MYGRNVSDPTSLGPRSRQRVHGKTGFAGEKYVSKQAVIGFTGKNHVSAGAVIGFALNSENFQFDVDVPLSIVN